MEEKEKKKVEKTTKNYKIQFYAFRRTSALTSGQHISETCGAWFQGG